MAQPTKTKASTTATSKPKAGTAAKAPAKTSVARAGTGAKTTAKKKGVGPKTAVFIDVENTHASRDNLLEIFTNLGLRCNVVYGKLYGYDEASGYGDIVKENRLDAVGKVQKAGGDSVVDTRLVIDCMLAAGSRKYEYIFVWAGIGDLASLFAQIKQQRCKTFTLDIPGYEIPDKLVDQKMRLFSPITKGKSAVAAVAVQTHAQHGSPVSAQRTEQVITTSSSTLPTSKPAPAVANDDDFEVDDDFDRELNFDDSILDGLGDLDDIEDDMGDYDDDLDDFADLAGEAIIDNEEDIFDSIEADAAGKMSADENARLLAVTQQMLRNMKNKKNSDANQAAKEIGMDDESLGIPPITEEERKATYGTAGFNYGADESNEAPDDTIKPEKEEPDEFGSFGKV